MNRNEPSGEKDSESADVNERRARWEGANYRMVVLDGRGGGIVNVQNQNYNEPGHIYSVEVENGHAVGCSCPNATYRGSHCKHQMAVEQRPLVVSSASAASASYNNNHQQVATDGGHPDPDTSGTETNDDTETETETDTETSTCAAEGCDEDARPGHDTCSDRCDIAHRYGLEFLVQ